MPDSLTVAASVFLIAGGHCGLPLVLVTLICSRTVAPRAVTLVNFLLCWIVYATAYLLLVYAGQQTGPEPEPTLCAIQAAMIHASTPLAASGALALVLQLLDDLGQLLGGIRRLKASHLIILLSVPWILFMIFFFAVLIIGLAEPSRVFLKNSSYCTIRDEDSLSTMNSVCALLGGIGAVAVQILIAWKLRCHARALRCSMSCSLPVSFYNLLIRLFIFTVYCIAADCVAFALIFVKTSQASFFFLSSLPLAVFLVFGTSRDLLNVWFLWWKERSAFVPDASSTRLEMMSQSQSITSSAEMQSGDVHRTDSVTQSRC